MFKAEGDEKAPMGKVPMGKLTNNNNAGRIPNMEALSKGGEVERLKGILGINAVKVTGLSAEILNGINNELELIYTEYPQLKGVIQQVKTTADKDAGAASFGVKYLNGVIKTALMFNSGDLRDMESVNKLIKEWVSKGYWTPKNGIGGIVRHEMAHVLELQQTFAERGVDIASKDVNGIVDRMMAIKAYGRCEVSDRIVRQAAKNIGDYGAWVELSKYARYNMTEAFAEALSDASEQPLSKEIIKITKRGFK